MSVTINAEAAKKLQDRVKGYTTSNTYKGMVMTVVIAIIILMIAFFLKLLKWVMVLIAVGLIASVGYRGYQMWKRRNQV